METVSISTVNTGDDMRQNQQDVYKSLSFNCSMCDQKFTKENYLEAHMFIKHENKSNDQCSRSVLLL